MRKIEDEFSDEKLTPAQRHWKRKVKTGLCTRGGCKVMLSEQERKMNKYLCDVHREIGKAYQRAVYLRSKSC